MSRRVLSSRIMGIVSVLWVCASPNASAAEIYAVTEANGAIRWATQALDASYAPAPGFSDPAAAAPSTRLVTPSQPKRSGSAQRARFLPLISLTAQRYGLERATLLALVEVESGFNAQAVSPKGARGLMQLMPATARRYGMLDVRELDDPARNLDIGARHLRDLLARHGGQAALAFAAYNAGQGAVAKHGQRIPSYLETMLYVPAVLAKAAQYNLPCETPLCF